MSASGDGRQPPVREDPRRGRAVPLAPLLRVLVEPLVREHPLVGRRAHRHRADAGEERAEALRSAAAVSRDLEQPVERVVRVGDVPVDAGRGEVLRPRHPRILPHRLRTPVRTIRGAMGESQYERIEGSGVGPVRRVPVLPPRPGLATAPDRRAGRRQGRVRGGRRRVRGSDGGPACLLDGRCATRGRLLPLVDHASATTTCSSSAPRSTARRSRAGSRRRTRTSARRSRPSTRTRSASARAASRRATRRTSSSTRS